MIEDHYGRKIYHVTSITRFDKHVTHQDVLAVRSGCIPSQCIVSRIKRAKCAQCKKVIQEPDRLMFVVPGLPNPGYMHVDESICVASKLRRVSCKR
jgi:hypothetical protein